MTVEAAGWLPLHLATENNAPLSVVKALLEADNTAQRPNFEGWLPLHFAVEQHSELALVRTLVDAHPDAVRGVTESPPGRTALHVAARERAPVEVLAALLEWNPAAARAKDGDGCLPLHLLFDAPCDGPALGRDVSAEQVRMLLDANPEAAREPDDNGELPLHLAASGSLPAVTVLLEAYPTAVTVRGSSGVPLKLASIEPVRAAIRKAAREVRAAAKAKEEAKAKAEVKKTTKKTGGQASRTTVKKAITKVASQPKKAKAKKK
jgi:ankyrin repeat protein